MFCIAGWLTGPIAKCCNHPYAQAVTVTQAIATAQAQASGVAVAPKGIEAAPFIVRVKLDNLDFVNRCPQAAPTPRRSSPDISSRPTLSFA